MSALANGPVKNTHLTKVLAQADTDQSSMVTLEELQAFDSKHQQDGYLSLVDANALDRRSQAQGLADATALMLKEYELFQHSTTGGAGIAAEGIASLASGDLDKTSISQRDLDKAKKSLPPDPASEAMMGNGPTGYGGYEAIYNNTNPYGPIYVPPMMNNTLTLSNQLVQQNAQFLDAYKAPPPAAKTVSDATLVTAPAEEAKKKGWWYRLWHKD